MTSFVKLLKKIMTSFVKLLKKKAWTVGIAICYHMPDRPCGCHGAGPLFGAGSGAVRLCIGVVVVILDPSKENLFL